MLSMLRRAGLALVCLLAAVLWLLPLAEAAKFLGGLGLFAAAIYGAGRLPERIRLVGSKYMQFRYVAILLLVVGIAFPYVAGPFALRFCSEALILGLLAMSLDVMMGHVGLASFAHAALAGIAAYTSAIFMTRFGWSPWNAIGIGMVAGTAATVVMGAFSVRVRDIYFGIITLVFGVIAFIAVNSWVSVTNGEDGMTIALPVLSIFGLLDIDTANFTHFWYLTFTLVFAGYFVLRRLMRSPIGLVFDGIRENERRARSIGYGVNRYKIANTAISGVFASLAGVLLLLKNGIIGTEQMNVIRSGEVVIWSVIGGLGTLIGPFLGAGVVFYFNDYLGAFTDRYVLIVGLVFIVVILLAPKGIVGALREAWRPAPGVASETTEADKERSSRRETASTAGSVGADVTNSHDLQAMGSEQSNAARR